HPAVVRAELVDPALLPAQVHAVAGREELQELLAPFVPEVRPAREVVAPRGVPAREVVPVEQYAVLAAARGARTAVERDRGGGLPLRGIALAPGLHVVPQ